jgi:hypothetical protein
MDAIMNANYCGLWTTKIEKKIIVLVATEA